MAKPPRLTEVQKDYAVTCFAKFMRPTQVCDALLDRFGVSIERNAVQMYDPTTSKGQTLGKKRKVMFEEVRKRFLDELDAIPIANKAMRLQQLQAHYDKVLNGATPNIRMALEILEKAAKEAGNVHSNEHHVHHSGKVKVEEVTEDEMRNGLAAAIAQVLTEEKARLDPATVTKH
jgi:hypothetical protein